MQNKSILLVEDSDDDVTLLLRALQSNHLSHPVEVVGDGEQALDFLFGRERYAGRDLSLQPQLILLDLQLPKMDALEVLKQIRADERTRFIPVVILTSSTEAKDIRACYQLGANSYLQKPLNFNQFIEAVREIATYWLHWNVNVAP